MPRNGPHRLQFEGKEPLVFLVLGRAFLTSIFTGLIFELVEGSLPLERLFGLPVVAGFSECWKILSGPLGAAIVLTMIIHHDRIVYLNRRRNHPGD
jgi:hypothetical protein